MSETKQITKNGSPEPKAPAREPTRRTRILLAEGDGFARVVLLFLLKMAGFDVDFASNGTLALKKLRTSHPDALLAEITLRGTSGLELIKDARRELSFGSKPIYVFTCVDLMSRATRKEVARLATKVFDKRSLALENLVKNLVSLLSAEGPDGEKRAGGMAGRLRAEALHELPVPQEIEEIITGVGEQSTAFVKSSEAGARGASCTELLSRVCALASCAEAAGLRNLVRQAKALEALLIQLCSEKKPVAESVVATVSRAVQVTSTLLRGPLGRKRDLARFTAVIVDEAAPSNMTISDAFRNAGFNPISFEESARAKDYLRANPADIVVANVLLPEAHGLTAAEIRRLPLHPDTPIMFVPETCSFERSKDELPTSAPRLNTKPLLVREIVIKALNEVQTAKAQAQEEPAAPSAPETRSEQAAPVEGNGRAPSSRAAEPSAWPALAEAGLVVQAPTTPSLAAPRASFAAEPANQVIAPGAGEGRSTKTVLFVEDDPFVLRVYRKYLKREGFEVEVAEDGLMALDMLPRIRPDVVVLDLMLPKLHGLEVLKFIRADVKLKATPVLVLSNAYLEGLADKANEAGANKGLLKTECSPAKLVQHLRELLGLPQTAVPPQTLVYEPNITGAQDDAVAFAETAIWTRQEGLRQDAPKEIARIRQVCLAFIKSTAATEKLAHLNELYTRVRFLSARASLSGMTKIAELSGALEGLLFQIVFKQSEPTNSTFQTIVQAVDCLDRLSQNRDTTFIEPRGQPRLLLVDDDAVCNFAMLTTLKRANFDAVAVQDPVDSLRLLKEQSFDLILLDISMPQLSGFEVCEHLRRMPQHQSVPVIFVSVDAGFQNRARSVVSGGNDLLAKPVCPLELILKVTMHLVNASSQGVSARAEPANQPLTWLLETMTQAKAAQESAAEAAQAPGTSVEPISAELAAAGTSWEPGQQAQPGATGSEFAAENLAPLPATSNDQLQTDDRPEEALQPSMFQPDAPELPGPEQTAWQQTAGAEINATAEQDAGEAAPASNNGDDATAIGAGEPPAPESGEPAPNAEGELDTQLHQLEQECARQREAAEKYQKERESLAVRICTTEMDLSRAQARIERREKTIEELRKQLEELQAHRQPPESNGLVQPGEGLPPIAGQLDRKSEALPPVSGEITRAEKEAQLRCAQLEEELAALLRAREELKNQFAQQEQAAAESAQRAQELEQRLGESAAELARATAELEKRKQEQERAESELRAQLEAASAASQQAEAAHQEAQARCGQLEQQLAGLHLLKEELTGKFGEEQLAAAESRDRIRELEHAKAFAERRAAEREQAESELRRQLETATSLSQQYESAHKTAEARCGQLEQELAGLRQAREELTGKFGKEQQTTTETRARIKELEGQLGSKGAELERARAEAEKQAAERARAESELRQQLEAASAANKQNEAAHKDAQARCGQLEQELAGLRQVREELTGKFGKEQQTTAESRARIKELEGQLGSKGAELERARAEAEKQAAERARAEAELHRQLETASAASKQNEAAHKDAQARCGQLEQELAGLRQVREDLTGKFGKEQQATAETRARIRELEGQLGSKGAELERARAEAEKQAAERARAESELRQQLEAASAANKQSEAAHKDAQARCGQLEQELAGLRQVREELTGKFGKEQQTTAETRARLKELEQAKARLEQRAQELEQVESALRRQLEAASAASQQNEAAHKEAQARCGKLEQDLAGLRQAREEFNRKYIREQLATADLGKRVKELEYYLNKRSVELERAGTEAEKKAADRARAESDLRRQLEGVGASLKQSQAAHEQAQARCGQLERELARLRQVREELTGKFGKEQQVTAETRCRIKELEGQLGSKGTELERARAEAEKQAAERARAESDLRRQLEGVGASLKQSQAAHEQAQARCGRLEQELAGLRQVREELTGKFGKEQQTTAETRARIKELESQLGSKGTELERARAEAEKQAAERARAESELRQQLETASAASKQNEAAHKDAQARCGQLEQELAGLRQVREELTGKFGKEQQTTAETRARIKELEGQLGAKGAELERARTEAEKQAAERSRAESDLRRQLEGVGASLKQSQAAHEQAQARTVQLQQELAGLRQVQKELTGRFGKEQQTTAETRCRIKELEGQLGSKGTELERTRAEAEKQAAERARAESDLRQQLEAASAANKQSEAAHKEAQARCGQLEQELAGLRQVREELTGKFGKEQQTTAETRTRIKELESQLGAKGTELERARAEAEKQAAERARAESDLRQQLETASAANRQSEAAHKDAQARCGQLEQELAGLRQVREELTGKFGKEQQTTAETRSRIRELEGQLGSKGAELERARAEAEKQASERARTESELRGQLETMSARLKQSQAAHDQAQAHGAQTQQELAAVHQAREELVGRLAREQQAAASARTRIKELEQQIQSAEAQRGAQIAELDQRVRQGVAALARASADLAQEQGQRQRSEQRATSLNARLQELHEELSRALQAQRVHLERINSLEEELRQTQQGLARRTADCEHQQAGRQLAEEQLQKAKELNAQFRKNLSYYEEAHRTFDRTRQDLETKLEASLNAARENEARFLRETAERERVAEILGGVQRELQNQTDRREALEQEARTMLDALNDNSAKLQKEGAERQRLAETLVGVERELQNQSRKRETLEQELQTTLGTLHEVEARLQNEAAERHRLAETLEGVQRELQAQLRKHETLEQELLRTVAALRDDEARLQQGSAERQQLAQTLDAAQRDAQNQSRKRESLEAELRSTRDVLQDAEAKLQQEVRERQRLNEALDAAELALRARSQQTELEHSKLQSDLQLERVERKRQETHMARMRHISLDAVRASRVVRNNLRRQIREPVDQLYESARSLLELEAGGEQKKLAEAVMHDVLLVRARLQEPEMGQSENAPAGLPDGIDELKD